MTYYYDRTAGRQLQSQDYFLLHDVTSEQLKKFFERLAEMLNPKKEDAKVDMKVDMKSGDILHKAVVAVCACEPYNITAPQKMCKKYVDIDQQLSYGELLIRYLCKMGADVNQVNSMKRTPIFYATRPYIIRVLRELGAKVTLKGNVSVDHMLHSGSDNVKPKTAVYLRMKERNAAAVGALLEWIPEYDNIEQGVSRNPQGTYYYQEGNYRAYFTDEPFGKVRVLNIDKKVSSHRIKVKDTLSPRYRGHFVSYN